MDLEELLASLEALDEHDDDALAAALDELNQASGPLLEDPTDANIALLNRIADAVDAVRAEQTTRTDAAAERATQAEALAARIRGEVDGEGDEPEAEPEAEPEPEAAEPEAAEPEAEPEAAEPEAEEPQRIAASTPRVGRVAARRPASAAPRATSSAAAPVLTLRAAANVPGVNAGHELRGPDAIADAFMRTIRASAGYKGPRMELPVASLGFFDARDAYGEDRVLDGDMRGNDRKIRAVTSPQAIRASGGICAPTPVQYDQPVIGSQARPVRDSMLARFGADRGGVRTLPPPVLADLSDATVAWTEANDETPSDPTTKPCLTLDCPDPTETMVDAITKCLEIGNYRARYFGEQVAAWIEMAAVNHARFAESRLLTSIGNGSTQVTTVQGLGATRDVLANLDRAHAAWASRRRVEGLRLRFGAPAWLRSMLRADLARGATYGTLDENFAVADAQLDSFFAARGINPTWFLDGESGQIFAAQGNAPLKTWPATTITYLYEEGSWLFLDGGSLDFGIVRDSTLNATNDFQMFSETFEAAHFHGGEPSQRITMQLCPDGSAAALADTSLICTDES